MENNSNIDLDLDLDLNIDSNQIITILEEDLKIITQIIECKNPLTISRLCKKILLINEENYELFFDQVKINKTFELLNDPVTKYVLDLIIHNDKDLELIEMIINEFGFKNDHDKTLILSCIFGLVIKYIGTCKKNKLIELKLNENNIQDLKLINENIHKSDINSDSDSDPDEYINKVSKELENTIEPEESKEESEEIKESEELAELVEELIEDSDEETEESELIDSDDNIQDEKLYEKIMENPFLRKQQKDVVKNLRIYKFNSGIVSQIMGAGKSFSILLSINSHYKHQIEEKKPTNNLYLILTERTEILKSWFFKKQLDDEQNEKYVYNTERFKFWKDNKIIDMDEFDLYENVIEKNSMIGKINKSSNKPIIYIVNNAYLKTGDKYKQIEKNKLKLVLVDECHCVSGKENYIMLKHFRYDLGSSIIGFSATPLRPTKLAEKYLLDIFGQGMEVVNNKLNIISEYNLMDALVDDIVLPFYQTIIYPKIKDGKIVGTSTNPNDITITKIIENYVVNNPYLPYKKCVIWVRNISKINDTGSYYKAIKLAVGDKFQVRRSYSKSGENECLDEINEFTQDERNSLLLCVNRVKEGSDIPNVDCAIFLDAVKNRSILVSLQSIGRVMRPDADKKKKYAYAYESVKVDENKTIEMLSVEKVLSYYKKILNLATLKDQEQHLDKILKLFNNTEVNEETKEVKIKITKDRDIVLKLDTENLNWGNFKKFLKKEFSEKIKMSRDKMFREIINKVKKIETFKNSECDFWKEYSKLDHVNLGIPSDFKKEFVNEWKKTNWYKELEIDIHVEYDTFKNFCIKNNIVNKKDYQKTILSYNIKNHQSNPGYQKYPMYPEEYFKNIWKGWIFTEDQELI